MTLTFTFQRINNNCITNNKNHIYLLIKLSLFKLQYIYVKKTLIQIRVKFILYRNIHCFKMKRENDEM